MTAGDPARRCPPSCRTRWSRPRSCSAAIPKSAARTSCAAPSPQWIGRRYGLAGMIDSDARDASRQRLARRPVLRRVAGRRPQELRGPARHADRQSLLSGLSGRGLRHRLRAGLSQRHRRDRLSARSRCAGARAGYAARAPRPSTCARRPTRRARWPARPTSPRRSRWRASTTSCCSWTSATRRSTRATRRPAACRSRPIRPSASRTSSSSIRSPSARTCRACARASPPATATSWRRSPRSAT